MSRYSILYVQYLLHMYNSAIAYIEAWVAIYQLQNRCIRISNISATTTHAQIIFRSLKCYEQSLKSHEHLRFLEPVVEISDRQVENVIFLGKSNTAIHSPHISEF